MYASWLPTCALGLVLAAPASAADWRETAERAQRLYQSGSGHERQLCMLERILESDSNDDRFAADAQAVEEMTGSLHEDEDFGRFVDRISKRLRDELGENGRLANQNDLSLMSRFDDYIFEIRAVIDTLKKKIDDDSAGAAQRILWDYIVENTKSSGSLYSCFADYYQFQPPSEE